MRVRFRHKIFQNEESGYTIASFTTKDESVPISARDKKYRSPGYYSFIALGYGFPLTEDIELEMEGDWVASEQHGLQYHVEQFLEVVPRTREGIIGYLSSGAIKGIGPATADQIYCKFGLDSLEVIDQDPEKLLCIKGITKRKLEDIKLTSGKNKVFRELMTLLSPYKVSTKKVNAILKQFGEQSIHVVQNIPFMLCAIKGFGFLTVDDIARKCGCRLNDPMRISGCVSYVLKDAMSKGHLYLQQEELISEVLGVLNHKLPTAVVSMVEVSDVVYKLIMQNSIINDNGRIYIVKQFEEERSTAQLIARRLLIKSKKMVIDQILQKAQKQVGIELSKTQEQAVRMVFKHPISIITGGPGTGKTTVLKVVLYIHQALAQGDVQLMAPTGRAARRMVESTGFSEASTMHLALGLVGDGESYQEFEHLEAELVNVDEFSMVDQHLAYEFFRHLQDNTRVLIVGDVDQLPSVGAGDVFRQLIATNLIPVTKLDIVYRQGLDSSIITNAALMQENKTAFTFGEDFQFFEGKDAEQTAAIVKELYLREATVYGTNDVQILTPFRKKSQAGVNEMNKVLRDVVNPKSSQKAEVRIGVNIFRVGDKIIQNKNQGEISNGEMGTVLRLYEDEDGCGKVDLQFSERKVTYDVEQMDIIEHAYATTVHKSQGSEYPVVIIPWVKAFYIMLKRNILYTAITRAKVRVIIVGEWSAVCQAIHTVDNEQRNTALAEKIIYFYQSLVEQEKVTEAEQLKLAI
ncbi:MAG: SF1B family DNA helicase RecD2 [Brevinema sp.]